MDYKIYRANTLELPITITNDDNTPKDLSECELRFTMRKEIPSSAVVDDSEATIAIVYDEVSDYDDPTTGEQTITLTPADTDVPPGTYVYDIDFRDELGRRDTLDAGTIQIEWTVTRAP